MLWSMMGGWRCFFLLEACQWRALGGDLRGPLNIQIKTHVGMDAS